MYLIDNSNLNPKLCIHHHERTKKTSHQKCCFLLLLIIYPTYKCIMLTENTPFSCVFLYGKMASPKHQVSTKWRKCSDPLGIFASTLPPPLFCWVFKKKNVFLRQDSHKKLIKKGILKKYYTYMCKHIMSFSHHKLKKSLLNCYLQCGHTSIHHLGVPIWDQEVFTWVWDIGYAGENLYQSK